MTAQFIKLVAVASWLWINQANLARTEPTGLITKHSSNTCQITNFAAGELLATSNLATNLSGQLSIALNCQGNASGNLLLTFKSAADNNSTTKMQFVNSSGVLAGASTNSSIETMTVKISSQGNQTGYAQFRVEIVAPNGKLLKSANDYQLFVTAEFINN